MSNDHDDSDASSATTEQDDPADGIPTTIRTTNPALFVRDASAEEKTDVPSPAEATTPHRTTATTGEDAIPAGTPIFLIDPSDDVNNTEILNYEHVAADNMDTGSGDSVAEESEELQELDNSFQECMHDRLMEVIQNENVESLVGAFEQNCIILKKGISYNVSLPHPPADWTPPTPKIEKNEPAFKDVDNPGAWEEFTFRPKFNMKRTQMESTYIMPSQQVQRLSPRTQSPTSVRSVDGNFTTLIG